MNIQQIPVTSTGHAYEVDFDALSDEIKLQLAIHGLKQKVNDCRGAWETDEEKDAASEKVLAAILAGEFRANSGARTSDPVGREVTRLATNLADQWARKQNGNLVSRAAGILICPENIAAHGARMDMAALCYGYEFSQIVRNSQPPYISARAMGMALQRGCSAIPSTGMLFSSFFNFFFFFYPSRGVQYWVGGSPRPSVTQTMGITHTPSHTYMGFGNHGQHGIIRSHG
jgi:hypothetical protein